MSIDWALANAGQKWASHLAATNTFEHCKDRDGAGENIAMSSSAEGIKNSDQATEMWYNEINDPGYDFNNQGFTSGTGHFTQVVWK